MRILRHLSRDNSISISISISTVLACPCSRSALGRIQGDRRWAMGEGRGRGRPRCHVGQTSVCDGAWSQVCPAQPSPFMCKVRYPMIPLAHLPRRLGKRRSSSTAPFILQRTAAHLPSCFFRAQRTGRQPCGTLQRWPSRRDLTPVHVLVPVPVSFTSWLGRRRTQVRRVASLANHH